MKNYYRTKHKVSAIDVLSISLVLICSSCSSDVEIPRNEGWINETYKGGRAIQRVSTDGDDLILHTDFHPRTETQGEVFFELENLPNVRGHTDFTGSEITVSFMAPWALVTSSDIDKSGAQIFLETENSDGKIARQYSPWKNLTRIWWNTIRFQPKMTGDLRGYHTDPGFDIERAVAIGFKLSLGSGSKLEYKGEVEITGVGINWPDSVDLEEKQSRLRLDRVFLQDEERRIQTRSTASGFQIPVSSPIEKFPRDIVRRVRFRDGLEAMSAVANIQSLGYPYENEMEVMRLAIAFEDYKDDIRKRSARIEHTLPSLIDVKGKKIQTWFAVDIRLRGVLSRPNRVSLELTDVNGRVMRGPWTNASVRAFQWAMVELVPTVDTPIPLGSTEDGFDMTRVKRMGVRFERGRFSHLIHKIPYPNLPPFALKGNFFLSEILVRQANVPISKTKASVLPKCTDSDATPVPLDEFIVGVNYAWIHYGWDVGRNPYGGRQTGGFSTHKMRLEKDFKMLKEHGVTLVRFFTLSDLRTGVVFNPDTKAPTGLDSFVQDDLQTIAATAHRHGIQLMPVLLDFMLGDGVSDRNLGNNMLWKEGEHPEVITDEQYRSAFLRLCVRPFMRELKALNERFDGVIYAIDIGNELGNAKAIVTPEHFKHLQQYVKDAIQIARDVTPKLKVTLGTRNRSDVVKYWKDHNLDIWQFHFYDDFEQEGNLSLDYQASCLGLNGPVIVGEVDPSNIQHKLDVIYRNGYKGVLFWSMHERDGFKIDLAAIRDWKAAKIVGR